MSIFRSLIKKEVLHIVRDRRMTLVVLIMPVILLLLFGFAISTEVNDVRVAAVVERHTDSTREVLERVRQNPYFTFCGVVSHAEATDMLRRGQVDAALTLRTDGEELHHQIIVDASNPTMAQTATGYLESAVSGRGLPVTTRTLYNPQLRSAYNFVPGIMGMIFILICAMMTSVSIVSEKETGTMDLLLVSPVRPATIILGKLIPYFLLSCIILALMLTLSYTLLDLPFSWSAVNVVWITILYVVLALGLGLFISTVATTQVSALIVSGMMFMIPVVMLSGMLFPIENMPTALQWFSCVIPARWYIEAMHVLMIQQLPLAYVIKDVAVLSAMTAVVMAVAIKKFNTRK